MIIKWWECSCVHEEVPIADFECLFFSLGTEFTGDTVMTIAVCQTLLETKPENDEVAMKHSLIQHMKKWGRKYPHVGWAHDLHAFEKA